MSSRLVRLGTVAIALLLGACSQRSPDMLAMKMELHALKQELEYVRQQTEDLDPRVRSAEQLALQVIDDRESPLTLDCSAQRPGLLATRIATLTAVCEGVEATVAGVRLRLKLGNPTSGRLEGLQLTFFAGEGAARGRSDLRVFQQVQTSLAPGTWKALEVELAGTPNTTSEFAIRAQVQSIALAQK